MLLFNNYDQEPVALDYLIHQVISYIDLQICPHLIGLQLKGKTESRKSLFQTLQTLSGQL